MFGLKPPLDAMEKLSDYVKTADAAEFLGVSQTTLRKYAATGVIPVRVNPANGYRLFKKLDLEQFLLEAAAPVKPVKAGKATKPK